MQSTAQIDCSSFDSEKGGVIQGKYTCTTTSDAKSGLGSASYGVSEAAAGLSVVGGLLQMLL